MALNQVLTIMIINQLLLIKIIAPPGKGQDVKTF